MTIHPAPDSGIKLGFAECYLEALALLERLRRLLLDVTEDEFERIWDLYGIQVKVKSSTK